ncbi:SAF domain-containing protein [Actinomyces capricornis]|uniref:SAF domain-containing protein n=1 Tax=Actinomyces capricornis TaxID=2755559 RepID=A0ABN6K5N4_9ACTO|nr:SAF domain-containing protein [Actinomyces capricornis]BDA64982.1 hypothetical protein MANAM107_18160 [Actinomyces capricornis]
MRRHDRDARGLRSTQAAKADSAGRLPSAPRERRPLLAVLAVLLIVGGAALAGFLATRLDHRVEMLVAADTIRAGEVIEREDLVSTPVSSGLGTLIRTDQVDQVVGRTARVEIAKGQLLDTSQLAAAAIPGEGRQVVGVSLEVGRFPANGFKAGDLVDVIDVNGQSVSIRGAQVLDAVPTSGTDGDWNSGAVVSIIVNEADAAALASAGAGGGIAVVLSTSDQPIQEG